MSSKYGFTPGEDPVEKERRIQAEVQRQQQLSRDYERRDEAVKTKMLAFKPAIRRVLLDFVAAKYMDHRIGDPSPAQSYADDRSFECSWYIDKSGASLSLHVDLIALMRGGVEYRIEVYTDSDKDYNLLELSKLAQVLYQEVGIPTEGYVNVYVSDFNGRENSYGHYVKHPVDNFR